MDQFNGGGSVLIIWYSKGDAGEDISSLRGWAAGILVLGGAVLALRKFWQSEPDSMPVIAWRLPLFSMFAVLLFAVLIDSAGLIVAAPVAMIAASYASPNARLFDSVIFATVMTAFGVFVFKYLLDSPIPLIAN